MAGNANSGRFPKKPPGTALGHPNRADRAQRDGIVVSDKPREHAPICPQPRLGGKAEWHPVVKAWWASLGASDLAKVAQKADWANAWIAADVLDQLYENGFSAGLLQQFITMADRLHAPRFDLLEEQAAEPVRDEAKERAQAKVTDIRSRMFGAT